MIFADRMASMVSGRYWLLWLPLLLVACSDRPSSNDDAVAAFIDRHWQHPLQAQGAPPDGYTALEGSLNPDDCGVCHAEQHAQWKTSLHSQNMGPGIQWQLYLMNQEEGNRCLRCHAPLAEQKALVALQQGWPAAPQGALPDYVPPNLADRGLICAACHVRQHEYFGPPARKALEEPLPHGGFTASAAFEDSRFCATCHQFPEDGPRVNGKLQEDTYAQWLASPQAADQSCQSCHMPDRQHLFRGIHDPDMVRQAIAVDFALDEMERDGFRRIRVGVENTGAAHLFPTYMVPKVGVFVELEDPGGEVRYLTHRVIGWGVNVELTEEQYDTRLPPGGRLDFTHDIRLPPEEGWRVSLRIEVVPREHYERMFKNSLRWADTLDARPLALLKQALAEAEATRFVALHLHEALPAAIAN